MIFFFITEQVFGYNNLSFVKLIYKWSNKYSNMQFLI